jgi:hypothetical protein
MAEILVRPEGDGYLVRVSEGGSESRHLVTVSDEDLELLGAGYGSAEELIEACFRFLLAREPKESILSRFDVREIGRYFPEFEEEIRRR